MRTLEDLITLSSESMKPPENLNAWEAAEKYLRVPGSSAAKNGRFSIEATPYLREPMEVLGSLEYSAMAFVGPARTGKSVMAQGWLTQTAMCDPADMLFVDMTQQKARDLSKTEITRLFNRSPEMKEKLVPGRQNDNTYDKQFLSGMRLLIRWPSINELSGKTIPRQWLFDYDRMEPNIDGEGPAFDLAKKRGQTFGRFAMCAVESSPGYDNEDPKFMPKTPHQAPPVKHGILEIYNRGDRRRFYWDCPACRSAFEPDFHLFKWPDSDDIYDASEQVEIHCPHCGFLMNQDMRSELNLGGRWVRDNMLWLPKTGEIVPLNGRTPIRSDIASFWMKAPPAYFTTWPELVRKFINAQRAYDESGDEGPLTVFTNTDLGLPYTPKSAVSDRVPEALKERAENWGASQEVPTVPEDVRFLIAAIDVQKRSFVVQVHGIAPGADIVVVDSFKIRKSKRLDSSGHPITIDPAAYEEDWDQLVDDVILRSYPLADGSGRKMNIMLTVSDSAGEEGVAVQALNFWRRLKQTPEGYHRRFALLRGDPNPRAQLLRLTYPEAGKNRFSGARGDVPVMALNSNALKDQLSNLLGRTEPGGGMIRWPNWMPDWFYTQLCAEVRIDGKWDNKRNRRNEAWDLLYYAIAFLRRQMDSAPWPVFRVNELDWDSPPSWAAEWDENDFVYDPSTNTGSVFVEKKADYSAFSKFGEDLA